MEKATNRELENTYVYLSSVCNPKYLKLNKNNALDEAAKFIVISKNKNVNKIIKKLLKR